MPLKPWDGIKELREFCTLKVWPFEKLPINGPIKN
jgi:hypothetical protein